MRKTARPVVWEGGDRKSTRLNSSHSLHAALPIKRDASTLSFSHAIGSSGLLKRLFQPPDAENRTSGGVGGWRGAIPVTRPDPIPAGVVFAPVPSERGIKIGRA